MDNYQNFIAVSRYARHVDGENRRETWEETTNRLINFYADRVPEEYKEEVLKLHEGIYTMRYMPSMRAMWTAGPALDRDHVAAYNCAYIAVDDPRSFDEAMYILMCGTGLGYSVERQYIAQLPLVAEKFHKSTTTIVVEDSKIGWANAFRELISFLYNGRIPQWDMSKVRPAGSILKKFGGRASGPAPLDELFRFSVALFKKAAGRRLNSLECHDLMCKIAQIVVVGGVRRSAMISLSNLSDQRMAGAKNGNWYEFEKQRALANNSACYTEKPDFDSFFKEMYNLYESKSGERGIFSRVAAQRQASKNGRRNADFEFGTNPCSEIILRPNQFCNLSEVVVRSTDTFNDLREKVIAATILGTIQSTFTNFRYLRSEWKKNCEEERLLGVSLTGVMDHPILSGQMYRDTNGEDDQIIHWLEDLREIAIETNREWADRLGINASAAITCVKPSGTVSQLVDSSSGMHPRYASHYIRTVRGDKKDPLSEFMIANGVPHEEDIMNPSSWVFSFPIEAPSHSTMADEMCALEQLELWKIYSEHWCEHKPSQTVYYTDDEFFDVCAWCWNHFGLLSGISFLPHSDHIYQQAPYTPVSKEEYEAAKRIMPKVPWHEFIELEDGTSGAQTYACTSGDCEFVDLGK